MGIPFDHERRVQISPDYAPGLFRVDITTLDPMRVERCLARWLTLDGAWIAAGDYIGTQEHLDVQACRPDWATRAPANENTPEKGAGTC